MLDHVVPGDSMDLLVSKYSIYFVEVLLELHITIKVFCPSMPLQHSNWHHRYFCSRDWNVPGFVSSNSLANW